jgi:hypothetical protein
MKHRLKALEAKMAQEQLILPEARRSPHWKRRANNRSDGRPPAL